MIKLSHEDNTANGQTLDGKPIIDDTQTIIPFIICDICFDVADLLVL